MGKKKFHIDQIKKEQIFKVPEDYFEQLPDRIESRIALESEALESNILSTDAIKSKQPFEVPNNYFESLQNKIEAKIANLETEEEVELNPLIFSKKTPFQTPNRYFNELPTVVQGKVEAKNTKWIFKLNWSPQVKWALAPAMILALAIGYIFFFNQNKDINTDELIAQVSTDDLIAYLEASDISTDEILESIDLNNISNELDINNEFELDDLEVDEASLEELIDEFDFTIDT